MTRPDVAILMGTYEGPEFFGRQLESIIAQTVTGWKLWISDDSSSTVMRDALCDYAGALSGRVQCDAGPKGGFVANFLHLACRADIDARYFAFADQDDIWDADKLERALAWLETVPESVPALYCGRVRLVDRDGRELGLSPLFARPPAFRNALVQSIAGGNTMVFNAAARRLLMKAGADVNVAVHDWWIYLVVSGCGGVVRYDACPSLSYRQHEGNVIGGNFTWVAMASRVLRALGGGQQKWHDGNLRALARLSDSLTPESRACLAAFEGGARPVAGATCGWVFARGRVSPDMARKPQPVCAGTAGAALSVG
ncbi:glycosyltransferase family 2 protein [uncultured Zoogloea sp.]|uniref:glycosyltransferase family 2 protein n=1 Tax=uncultured Zoogloea sp. TaxID=160237 RepID=UPI002609E810|nr:glycosyltransferase family 2 protein [uncultured Zoogloea sp.]